jgi:hypothetical protein
MSMFEVLRKHYGDRTYEPGDVREAREASVLHLVRSGVLRKMDDTAYANKMEGAPANKAAANPTPPAPTGGPTGEAIQPSSSPVVPAPKKRTYHRRKAKPAS